MMTCTIFGTRCSNGNFSEVYTRPDFMMCLPHFGVVRHFLTCLPKCAHVDAVEILFVVIESVFELEISFCIAYR